MIKRVESGADEDLFGKHWQGESYGIKDSKPFKGRPPTKFDNFEDQKSDTIVTCSHFGKCRFESQQRNGTTDKV